MLFRQDNFEKPAYFLDDVERHEFVKVSVGCQIHIPNVHDPVLHLINPVLNTVIKDLLLFLCNHPLYFILSDFELLKVLFLKIIQPRPNTVGRFGYNFEFLHSMFHVFTIFIGLPLDIPSLVEPVGLELAQLRVVLLTLFRVKLTFFWEGHADLGHVLAKLSYLLTYVFVCARAAQHLIF